MQRRDFIKLSLALSSMALMPQTIQARVLDLNEIQFSQSISQHNKAQTLIIYLYGGASQLAGNLSNLDEIEKHSQSSYKYFGDMTQTTNKCWKEAGGEAMENLMASGDMTLFRACYSEVRESTSNKAHGVCTEQNQKGTFDANGAGILANLAEILEATKQVGPTSVMPFVTMEGESHFYTEGNKPVSGYLKPVGVNEAFDNPYQRNRIRRWYNYTDAERKSNPDGYYKPDAEGGFAPALDSAIDALAQSNNRQGAIKEAFEKRASRSLFMESIAASETPDLGKNSYPKENPFAQKIEAGIKLLIANPETRVLTMGTGGLGGWDDHNDARDYVGRMESLWLSLESAIAHLKAKDKIEQINIMVFAEFGRNVNLNAANGWDHGNLQNFYVLGGNGYFKHKGVVGETIVDNTGSINRLYHKPKETSYWFEPLSIAATLYKIYGIENPKIMTDGYGVIDPLFS